MCYTRKSKNYSYQMDENCDEYNGGEFLRWMCSLLVLNWSIE